MKNTWYKGKVKNTWLVWESFYFSIIFDYVISIFLVNSRKGPTDDQTAQQPVNTTEWKHTQRKEQRLQIYASAPDALPSTLLKAIQRTHIKRQTTSLEVKRYSDCLATLPSVSGSSQDPITIEDSSSEGSSAETTKPSYLVFDGTTSTSLSIRKVTKRKDWYDFISRFFLFTDEDHFNFHIIVHSNVFLLQ